MSDTVPVEEAHEGALQTLRQAQTNLQEAAAFARFLDDTTVEGRVDLALAEVDILIDELEPGPAAPPTPS